MYLSVEIKAYIRDIKYTVLFIDALNSSKDMKCLAAITMYKDKYAHVFTIQSKVR